MPPPKSGALICKAKDEGDRHILYYGKMSRTPGRPAGLSFSYRLPIVANSDTLILVDDQMCSMHGVKEIVDEVELLPVEERAVVVGFLEH